MKERTKIYGKTNGTKKLLCLLNIMLAAVMLLCSCDMDYSSDAGSSSQTEAPKKVHCIITVNYDETIGEYLFGNNEKFYISLDGEEIGKISSATTEGTVKKDTYLTVGKHTVKAESSKEKLFDFNSVSFDVKETEGLYTAELKMKKGSLELVQTHIDEPRRTDEPAETVSVNMDDYVEVSVSVITGLSTIPDIFSHEFQSFTVYIDGEEVTTIDSTYDSLEDTMYFEKGTHKISIRKNNTDDYDYDTCFFDVTDRTTELYFTISHNQLLDTFSIKQND